MSAKFVVLVTALFWLGDQGRRHGVLGRSLANYGRNSISPELKRVSGDSKAPRDINHWAGYQTGEGEHYGTVARINAWNLKLKPGQISRSVVWLSSDGGNNQVMAGFQVSPDIYSDSDLHFFVSWTTDGFNSTGCLDTNCQGFVLSSTSATAILSPGSTVAQPSVYHGKQTEYTITIQKEQDPAGNWSLYVDVSSRKEPIGHFTGALADHATLAGWGGSTWSSASSPNGVSSPPMGSGHRPRQELGGNRGSRRQGQLQRAGGRERGVADQRRRVLRR
ncbi:hypothetical protein BS78_02G392800 [Paspalum vaginatum]|nr:hypothetical protein BS78_02G392800 [Paspalum vaginatum]